MTFCKAAVLAVSLAVTLQYTQAARLVVFGDGLADDGNGAQLYAQNATNNANLEYPPAPYYDGRFTNGQVIPEYLAQYLNLTLFDFAIGGATSGASSSFFTIQANTTNVPANFATPRNIGVPSVLAQVTNYVNLTSGAISAADYYGLIVGSNDYYDILGGANVSVASVVGNITQSAVALYQGGARKIVIAEVPPLQLTPFGQAQTAAVRTQLTTLVSQHNAVLSASVINLTSTYPQGYFGILPTYEIVTSIASNPTRYGYTNSGSQCYGTAAQPVPAGTGALCANPATHIFWDRLNPTTYVHQQIAATAAREIGFSAGVPAMAPAGQAPVPAPAGLIAG